jgi:hypothetical protein
MSYCAEITGVLESWEKYRGAEDPGGYSVTLQVSLEEGVYLTACGDEGTTRNHAFAKAFREIANLLDPPAAPSDTRGDGGEGG